MILCDLPYGTTACKWDNVIPFEPLWTQYKRIIKDNGAIVLFGSEPFSSYLRLSNINNFMYDWIWNKKLAGNFIIAKSQPQKIHEIISVFNKHNYYFQKTPTGKKRRMQNNGTGETAGNIKFKYTGEIKDWLYPKSIIEIGNTDRKNIQHPTQKPVALFEYLIKTYTNENELVLDNCIGSGTTAIACMQTNRNFIGIELEPKYVDIANKRIADFKQQLVLI
jgi:site-specific DNA-methyltransferase (adenine-specific)